MRPVFPDYLSISYDCGTTDFKKFLKSLRTSNPDKLIFAHLNLNCIRNKFEMLSDQIKGIIGVLLVSATKIGDSFPTGNF